MTEKEIAELRRRFKPDKSNISAIRGCYVNEKQEIISEFNQSIALMPENEAEKLLTILKKTLSGTLDKNLLNLEFTTQQVVEGEEHKLLMALRRSKLNDEEAVQALFQRIIASVVLEENYLILLAQDAYDVPYRSKNDDTLDDASSDIFSYCVCCICPVKMTKPALSYHVCDNAFQSAVIDRIVSPPEMGFMFPAFDDRAANIYGALYYTRDIADNHEDFMQAVLQCEAPKPAAIQKELFGDLLGDALTDDCRYDVVRAVHGQLQEIIEVHKENKEETPLRVSKSALRQILHDNGVSETSVAAFDDHFDLKFGADASISPKNIVDTKQIAVKTPDVTISVAAGCGDLLETRIIDGAKYILIRAEDGVELNGVAIQIV